MGKKGSWISALKRVFASSSKDKLVINGPDREFVKEKKKWAIGKLRHGGTKPFIHLHKEPSSIEKILGDAEREQHAEPPKRAQHRSSSAESTLGNAETDQTKPSPWPPKRTHQPKPPHPSAAISTTSPRRAQQPKTPPPSSTAATRPAISPSRIAIDYTQKSAIKIQAAYRGYMARKNYGALKALVRLQGVMRGQGVKRQAVNAMRLMQLFVRVQSQVRMRRIQAMESQHPRRHTPRASEKEQDSNTSKWNLSHKSDSEEQTHEEWDGSLLTKKEIEARLQRKVEAVIKRGRALAYATSHQKETPKSPRSAKAELRSRGVPVWWGWLERHFQAHHPARRAVTPRPKPGVSTNSANWVAPDTRTRPGSRSRRSSLVPEKNPEPCTPRSPHAPGERLAAPQNRVAGLRPLPRDDESLTSCPAFTAVPGYMAATLSAKAKVREQAFFNRDVPPAEAKKRFSFGLSQSIGTLRWSKGSSLFAPKDGSSPRTSGGKHRKMASMGNMSVDSTLSLPLGAGKKPFR